MTIIAMIVTTLMSREPELELAEDIHRDEVDAVEHAQRDQRRDPLRDVREPVVDVDRDGGDLGHAGDHPHEPVGPAGGEAGPRADELLGIGGEGAGDRAVHQELAQGPHDEEDREAAERVGQQQARGRPR